MPKKSNRKPNRKIEKKHTIDDSYYGKQIVLSSNSDTGCFLGLYKDSKLLDHYEFSFLTKEQRYRLLFIEQTEDGTIKCLTEKQIVYLSKGFLEYSVLLKIEIE
jgi:hypothetical protein